jgi:hypothetical protein
MFDSATLPPPRKRAPANAVRPLLDILEDLAGLTSRELDDAERIEQIALLERIKSAASAAQAVTTRDFDASQRAMAAERGVPAPQQGQGVAEQVGLARRESPFMGARHVGLAKALVDEMPHTLAALVSGRTSEWRATVMVRETAALNVEDRAAVDAEVGPRLGALGDRAVANEARKVGYRLDPQSLVRRIARAEADRCVTIRPAPDCMTYVTALLPVARGVAVYAALRRHADSLRGTGDARSRGQLMADTLVSRTTGLTDGVEPDVEIQLVMTDRTLLDGHHEPGRVTGHGVVPAWLSRRIAREAERVWVRRLYRSPGSGELICADAKRRLFTTVEKAFLVARDEFCRTPWCNAPIRHADHVLPVAEGGETSLANGQGLCARCNYAKEAAGWWSRVDPSLRVRHRVLLTTPTGHTYCSEPPRPPEAGALVSQIELYLSDLVLQPG